MSLRIALSRIAQAFRDGKQRNLTIEEAREQYAEDDPLRYLHVLPADREKTDPPAEPK